MSVLIPVQYPLQDRNRNAIETGLGIVADDPDPEVLILHVNRLHEDGRVTRSDLQKAIEAEFGPIPAHYVVRDGFLYEEAILNEATRHNIAHVVLSEQRRDTWQRLLRRKLGLEVDLESFLHDNLDADIHVVKNDRERTDETR